MRDKQNERQLSSDRAEESALVAFLTEAVGGPAPPDLSAEIMRRFHAPAGDTELRPPAPTPLNPRTPANRQRNLAALVSLVAAIAAVVLVVVTLRNTPPQSPRPEVASDLRPAPVASDNASVSDNALAADNTLPAEGSGPPRIAASPDGSSRPADGALAGKSGTQASPRPDGGTAQPIPPQGTGGAASDSAVAGSPRPRPRSMGSAPFAASDAPASALAEVASKNPARSEPQSADQIAQQLRQQFDLAWQHLGVAPTPAVGNDEVARRIGQWLEVPVTAEQAADPQAVAALLRSSEARSAVSRRLLSQLLGPAWPRVQPEPKQTLVRFVAQSLAEGQRFDVLTQQLFVGSDGDAARNASAAWLSALAGERSVPVTQQVGHALLDMDLACARCHDDPIDSQIRQQDFWALAAVFENGLQYSRNQSGEPLVLATTQAEPPKGQFFELPDGRQRVALPAMPPAWLDLQIDAAAGGTALPDLSSVSAQWQDNPRLARSLVNRVWTAVYGRPLTGAVSDPDAPPSEEHFIQLRDYLAAQTRAHDFDLAALFSWVLTAPPMHRTVVLEPLSDRAAFASDEQLAHAEFMHRTFAGYESAPAKLSFSGLLSMASRWNGGGTIESLPALAQPSASDAAFTPPKLPSDAERTENWLRASFPEKASATAQLPAQWLGSIDSFEQQARHLYYAAGYWKPSDNQMQAARELEASAADPAIALKQLWWALRNSR